MTWDKRVKALLGKSSYQTVTDLAGAAGVSAASLGQALRGLHTPKSSTLEKVAEVLGTTAQYILYGEGQAPGQTVPVLTCNDIGLWLMDKLDINDFPTMTAPSVMGDKSFAWQCDVIDMEPLFPQGCTIFFEVKNRPVNEGNHLYAMAAPVYRKGGGNPAKSVQFQLECQNNPDLQSQKGEVFNYGDPVFREVGKTADGVTLRPVNPQFSPIPMNPMEIIAVAKYCLIDLKRI